MAGAQNCVIKVYNFFYSQQRIFVGYLVLLAIISGILLSEWIDCKMFDMLSRICGKNAAYCAKISYVLIIQI